MKKQGIPVYIITSGLAVLQPVSNLQLAYRKLLEIDPSYAKSYDTFRRVFQKQDYLTHNHVGIYKRSLQAS